MATMKRVKTMQWAGRWKLVDGQWQRLSVRPHWIAPWEWLEIVKGPKV